jgi:hypothetical protein
VREAGEPVIERAGRITGVQDRVHHGVRHRADLDDQRRPPCLERLEVTFSVGRLTRVADDERGKLRSGAVRCVHEPCEDRQIVRGIRDSVAVEPQELGGGVDRVCDEPAHDRSERMEAERERRDDAEIPSTATGGPEQVRV